MAGHCCSWCDPLCWNKPQVEIVNCLQSHWFLPSVICPDLTGTGSVCRCYSPNQWVFTMRLSALIDPADGHQIFTRTAKKCIRLLKQKLQKCDVCTTKRRSVVIFIAVWDCVKWAIFRTCYTGNINAMSNFLRAMLKAIPRNHINQHLCILASTVVQTKHHTHTHSYMFSRMSMQTLI